MPRFCRALCGPRVMTSPQVTSGATSPGQQCWMGRRARSTSWPSHTSSWQGGLLRSLGAMFHRVLSRLLMPTISLKPLGASGSLSEASSSPKGRSPAMLSTPMARATRSGVPNRLASTGMVWPVGLSNSSAGPPARSTRSASAVISRWGETGSAMRRRSPLCSSWARKLRRSCVGMGGFSGEIRLLRWCGLRRQLLFLIHRRVTR